MVQRLNADLITGRLPPESTVRLACDLLMVGVETPTVVELAGESPTRLTLGDAVPLVRQVLVELGVEPVDPTKAAWTVARDVARQMLTGDLLPEDGAAMLWDLWEDCENSPVIARMLEPLEAWQETLPEDRDDEAIRDEMRRLAPAVVHTGDARLAAEEPGGRA
ncbi:hypothetical protein ACQEVB_29280 [Pseudonocardia sp. CA-107938]|uniref:hypothetical protein n=1 Tax=Pseudonocardia sp. CA-107938 TaxID=3240021 RepID=UPI003D942D1F